MSRVKAAMARKVPSQETLEAVMKERLIGRGAELTPQVIKGIGDAAEAIRDRMGQS